MNNTAKRGGQLTSELFTMIFFGPNFPGYFRSWESPQTLPAVFIGPFEYVERFQNLTFADKRITNIQNTVISSSEDTAAIHLAFK